MYVYFETFLLVVWYHSTLSNDTWQDNRIILLCGWLLFIQCYCNGALVYVGHGILFFIYKNYSLVIPDLCQSSSLIVHCFLYINHESIDTGESYSNWSVNEYGMTSLFCGNIVNRRQWSYLFANTQMQRVLLFCPTSSLCSSLSMWNCWLCGLRLLYFSFIHCIHVRLGRF